MKEIRLVGNPSTSSRTDNIEITLTPEGLAKQVMDGLSPDDLQEFINLLLECPPSAHIEPLDITDYENEGLHYVRLAKAVQELIIAHNGRTNA